MSVAKQIKEDYKYKVSIIVPCYNTKPWLDECLQSLVNQTLQDIEIICINDGSTDGTGERLDEWRTKYSNKIKVIHQQNGGLSNARNAGMKIAHGECIGFVDSDDFVDVTMYEQLYEILIKNNADSVKCDFFLFNDGEKINLKNNNPSFIKQKILKEEDLHNTIFNCGCFFTGGYINKKSFLEKNNIKFQNNIRYLEDYTFCYDMTICNPKVFKTEDKLYYYRQLRLGKLTLSTDKKLFDIFKVYSYINNKKSISSEIYNKLFKHLLQLIFLFIKKIKMKYKIKLFLLSSVFLFSNYETTYIYKKFIKVKRKNILNYLLGYITIILLHFYYTQYKLFYLTKNYIYDRKSSQKK